jgi:hypothetical protein
MMRIGKLHSVRNMSSLSNHSLYVFDGWYNKNTSFVIYRLSIGTTSEDVSDTALWRTKDGSGTEQHHWRRAGGYVRSSRRGLDTVDGTSTIKS